MTTELPDNFRVCALADIPNPGSRAFVVEQGDWPLHGFVVRKNDQVFAYLNVCPHAGRMLNWGPHRFLTKDQTRIMCAAHGANFEIETGLCIAGPCLGDALTKLAVSTEDGQVVVYPGMRTQSGR